LRIRLHAVGHCGDQTDCDQYIQKPHHDDFDSEDLLALQEVAISSIQADATSNILLTPCPCVAISFLRRNMPQRPRHEIVVRALVLRSTKRPGFEGSDYAVPGQEGLAIGSSRHADFENGVDPAENENPDRIR